MKKPYKEASMVTPDNTYAFFLNDEWRVYYRGVLCKPSWEQKGPAMAYIDMCNLGTRKPEYCNFEKEKENDKA